MTSKQVIEILTNHQLWRLGSDDVKMTDAKELTAALDIAINVLRNATLDGQLPIWSVVI